MSTWPAARAAIAAHLDARTLTVPGHSAETLDALEFPPGGRQDSGQWPYCFIVPTGQTVNRASALRRIERDVVVRVMLVPTGQGYEMESLAKRYEAWKNELTDRMDSAITINGTATVFGSQSFGDLVLFEDIDAGWGFDMTLGSLQITAAASYSG
jgi:hypothetical protein